MNVTTDSALIVALLISGLYGVVITLFWWRAVKSKQSGEPGPPKTPKDAPSSTESEDRVRHYQAKADEAMRLSQTFQKFVPRQFVDHFAKHGSDTLELGHADEDDVAILFCDIRGFTGLSERMKPQELMNFLNSYFLRMNGPIHQNNGFIDKFIGDAIMALFDHPGGDQAAKAKDALNAALDLRQALSLYNQHRHNSGYDAINIGVGIHLGPVIIGTVGSDDRMDTTVIGDSVNIAYRLEGLAPRYHADIVVSAQLLATLDQSQHPKVRILDWVRVKGRQAAVEVYEVLDHLPEPEQALKLATHALIQQGLAYRKKLLWSKAIDQFQQALAVSPADPVIQLHLELCHHWQDQDFATDWDGAL